MIESVWLLVGEGDEGEFGGVLEAGFEVAEVGGAVVLLAQLVGGVLRDLIAIGQQPDDALV